MKNITKFALLILASSSLAFADESAAVAAKFAKIPKPAAEALHKAAGSAKIESLEIEKDGKVTVYEIAITEAGKPNREISVTADGKLNAEEVTTPLADVPAVVRKAIEAGAKGATIQRVQHISRGGKVTYEAQYVKKGKETEVEYLEDGTVKPE